LSAFIKQASSPSYVNGFARSPGQSANPGLWREMVEAIYPAMGNTGLFIEDLGTEPEDVNFAGGLGHDDWRVGDNASLNGYALDFSNGGERLDLGDSKKFDGARAVSYAGWFYFKGAGGTQSIVREDGTVTFFQLAAGAVQFALWAPVLTSHRFFISLNIGEWTHFAARWANNVNSGTPEFFMNGKNMGNFTKSSTGTIASTTKASVYGATETGGERFNGLMQSCLKYRRFLSDPEIKQLYLDAMAPFRLRRSMIPFAIAAGVPIGIPSLVMAPMQV